MDKEAMAKVNEILKASGRQELSMDELDQVKGQAYVTSAITVGGVFSNLISGVILDNLGIKAMLGTGCVVCAVGVIIGFVAMSRLPHHA